MKASKLLRKLETLYPEWEINIQTVYNGDEEIGLEIPRYICGIELRPKGTGPTQVLDSDVKVRLLSGSRIITMSRLKIHRRKYKLQTGIIFSDSRDREFLNYAAGIIAEIEERYIPNYIDHIR